MGARSARFAWEVFPYALPNNHIAERSLKRGLAGVASFISGLRI